MELNEPQQPDVCSHGKQELRRRTFANGTIHFVEQCLNCGMQVGSAIKREDAYRRGGVVAPAFDDSLQESYWQSRHAERDAERSQLRNQRIQEYRDYLESEVWRRKRNRRLAMDRWQCQARMDGCLKQATEVHHLTYTHLGDEPLFELVSVCEECHRRISLMDGSITEEVPLERAAS